jgi:hypothetical protein
VAVPRSRPLRRRPAPGPPDPGVDDLLFLIEQEQEAIRHADTKLGLLLTAEGLVVSRLLSGRDTFLHPSGHRAGISGVTVVVVYYSACVILVVSLAFLVVGLIPRRFLPDDHDTDRPGSGPAALNRFAWPAVAEATFAQMTALTTATLRPEAVQQVLVLARIAKVKFRMFDRSLYTALLSGVMAAVWALVR